MQYYMAVAIYCAPLHTIYRTIYYARYSATLQERQHMYVVIFSRLIIYAHPRKLDLNTYFDPGATHVLACLAFRDSTP